MQRLTPLILAALLAPFAAPSNAQTVQPPTVGCATDGMNGPLAAPAKTPPAPRVSAAMAGRLAFYASEYVGVLGPRGWKCFGLYGSNGASLYVVPALPKDWFKAKLTGPAIELATPEVETSGRFETAEIAARLFPNRGAFVAKIVAEGIEKASDFPTGHGPHDRVQHQGPNRSAFQTAAGKDGIGTGLTRMVAAQDPIQGVAVIGLDNEAKLAAVRLPPAQRDLAPVILAAVQPDKGP